MPLRFEKIVCPEGPDAGSGFAMGHFIVDHAAGDEAVFLCNCGAGYSADDGQRVSVQNAEE